MANKNEKYLKSLKFNSLVRGGAPSRPGLLAVALTEVWALANNFFSKFRLLFSWFNRG